MRKVFALMLVLGAAVAAQAAIELPGIIADRMVLQRGAPAPIWGWGTPGETITVRFGGQEVATTADAEGAWQLKLAPLEASAEPRSLTITGSESGARELQGVLVGEVWLCSGQSNMQWPVGNALDSTQEIANATYPQIRLYTVPSMTANQPMARVGGNWQLCEPASVAGFSAVGYYFGRRLHQQLGVPIGLIDSSWGGTVAEAWTSAPALRKALPEFAPAIDEVQQDSESLRKARQAYAEALAEQQKAIVLMDQLMRRDDPPPALAEPDLDDPAWKSMKVPAYWETQLHGFDGIVWFRKVIEVPPEWAGRDLLLRPGPIDEVDVTWFNNIKVGGKGSVKPRNVSFWNQPRDYRVPGELVKAGKNVITIQVFDAAGQGGLWNGKPEEMIVVPADAPESKPIALAGQWQFRVGEYRYGENNAQIHRLELPPRPRNPEHPNRPSVLYNSMIHPLIPFALRGAIWYQGESNASRAEQYRTLLPTMIGDWRERWGADFPFLIVQLANFRKPTAEPVQPNGWASLREAQAMTAANDPNTGLATAIDIGDADDIHPRNKQEVGRRLALVAEAMVYDRDVIPAGPTFTRMEVRGAQAILHFDHVGEGLELREGTPNGFAIAGEHGHWHHAEATIQGKTVVLSADAVERPVAVRYAWADNPPATLYNSAGLPAFPFRTD